MTPRFSRDIPRRRAGRLPWSLVLGSLLGAGLLSQSAGTGDDPPRSPARSETPLERLTFNDEAKVTRTVAGRVLLDAEDGGVLLQGQDGRLWNIEKEHIATREPTGRTFEPLSAEQLGKQVATEVGGECDVVVTRHYVICSRAGKPYAQWCGALFERLYAAFHNYWKQRGVKLRDPEFPLIAVVFANDRQFAEFATKDAGPDVATAKGYYSIGTNRIAIYDLTAGTEGGATTAADISRKLAAAPFNIATVIHEATHQIAFNTGLHTRYADNPLWLTEGMAMYFETPDLSSRSGWKTVGAVNDLRLKQFLDLLPHRSVDSLATLIQSDARFTDPDQMGNAYAEAWALSYFLIKTRKDAYTAYLRQLAGKSQLVWDRPEQRLTEFRQAFGEDLLQLDAEFVKFMRRVK